jgi:hypothetical protein
MDEKICHLQKRVDQMRLDLDDQESILWISVSAENVLGNL